MNGTKCVKMNFPKVYLAVSHLLSMCGLIFLGAVLTASAKTKDDTIPTRVLDLAYGSVLYEYYQGHAFEALTLLNVSNVRGGISGHGDHPALVEGGLMLSYGMVQEAKKLFESVLKEQVSASHKNRAWFYLAKVFYLQQEYQLSLETLEKVDQALLKSENTELFYETVYLKGQIAHLISEKGSQFQQQISVLPATHIFSYYLQYNQAVISVETGRTDEAINRFSSLAASLAESENEQVERQALKEQSLLSLGQLYLQKKQPDLAFKALSGIRKGSVFSDQALFSYAVAAANLDKFGLALEALNLLKSRPLFMPWLQQVPYALAYLYEQLEEPELALQAYRAAADHYQNLAVELKDNSNRLSEQTILKALKIDQTIGQSLIETDFYGHLKVQPTDFNIAALLASEVFQNDISELHELYKLRYSLSRWAHQLDSFDQMMITRNNLREQKIQQTANALAAQQAELWRSQQHAMSAEVYQAIKSEDSLFFMTQDQIDYHQQIQGVYENLSSFPEGDEKQAYLEKINRIERYFTWWVSDTYGVNRWQAEKQVITLKREMTAFDEHHRKLVVEMSSNDNNAALASRVSEGRQRLALLRQNLELSLEKTRVKLLMQVRADIKKQSIETQNYLLAARESQARLADVLYRKEISDNQDKAKTSEVGVGVGELAK